MKRVDLAYIAGIIDGEGCICPVSRTSHLGRRYNIELTVEMTDRTAIDFIQAIVGGNIYHKLPEDENHKESWRWIAKGEKAKAILKVIKPFLLVKRGHAELALRLLTIHERYQRYTPMERFLQEADALAIKKLNR